ncbi:hypothetical protein K502DRAFT_125778 [Neoconidiobolus thromboides FSU 785]|nr:hypothetical protein K502DRAFT_125778 [Neoconidiobolus thromboides FSU 785]
MKQTSCVNCKKGKRKCSRDQPKCERCQKLKKNCVYIEVVNKKICLEQKMAKIEYCYKIIKKTALQNQLEVYKNLISHYFTNFGVFIPFIQLQKGLKAIEYEPHNSLLANALCILPYQFYLKENNILNNKGSDNKNPFYTRATTLLTSLTDNSDLDTIQSLLLISYYELGESQLPISLKHLSQAVRYLYQII